MSDTIKILGKLKSGATHGIVAESDSIYDVLMNDYQENINKKTKVLYEAYVNGELGGSDNGALSSEQIASSAMTWIQYGNVPWEAKLDLYNDDSDFIEIYNRTTINDTIYVPINYDSSTDSFTTYNSIKITNAKLRINYESAFITESPIKINMWLDFGEYKTQGHISQQVSNISLGWEAIDNTNFNDIILHLKPIAKTTFNNAIPEMYITGETKEYIIKKYYPIIYGDGDVGINSGNIIMGRPVQNTSNFKNLNGNKIVNLNINAIDGKHLYFLIPSNITLNSISLSGVEIGLATSSSFFPIGSSDNAPNYKIYASIDKVVAGEYNVQLNIDY